MDPAEKKNLDKNSKDIKHEFSSHLPEWRSEILLINQSQSSEISDDTEGGDDPTSIHKARMSEALEDHLLQQVATSSRKLSTEQATEDEDVEEEAIAELDHVRSIVFREPEIMGSQYSNIQYTESDASKHKLVHHEMKSELQKVFDKITEKKGSRQRITLSKTRFNLSGTFDEPRMKSALRSTQKTISHESVTSQEKKFTYFDYSEDDIPTEMKTSDSRDSEEKRLRFRVKRTAYVSQKGMRLEFNLAPTTCDKYLNVEDYAEIFVDEIIEEAISKERSFKQLSAIKVVEGITYADSSEESSSIESIGTYICTFDWPTIEEFDVDLGMEKISEYLSYWKFEEDWKFCINFLYGESDVACDFFQYEAIFSIPCKQYPIPQATASVFFTFELSRIRPKHCFVDLYYRFEGQRLVHNPGRFTFHEQRLFNIVDAKIKFYKTLTF